MMLRQLDMHMKKYEAECHTLHICPKINSKWTKDLNVQRARTLKFRGKQRSNLHDFGFGSDFFRYDT